MNEVSPDSLVDKFGRRVNYVRMSVTDRCDFRCVYCMAEEMTFLPRAQVLTFEEMELVAKAFVSLGVTKIRLTGGEPLVRAGVIDLCERLGQLSELNELVMTTNGSHLEKYALPLKRAGIRRLNISLDSLKPERFKSLTRVGNLERVVAGIHAAKKVGFDKIKLNAVVLKGRNDDEVSDLVQFAVDEALDISFIEEMPLGSIKEHSREEAFMSSQDIMTALGAAWTLREQETGTDAGGPSRYFQVSGTQTRVGFISPHSHNFCAQCNRVRVTAEGRLLLCLGNEHSVDLKGVLRRYPGNMERLRTTLIDAMGLKPERHYFDHSNDPDIIRFMNATGG